MLTHNEVTKLVEQYNDGDTEAVGKLVPAFTPYLKKWVDVLKGRWINVQDPEVAAFVSMIKCDSLTDLSLRLSQATSHLSDTDLLHEMIVLFLTLAKRYSSVGSGFTAYLSSTMKYRVFDWVVKELRHPLVLYCNELPDAPCEDEGVPDTIILSDNTLFSELSATERAVIYMRFVDGMSTEDIAERRKCSQTVINNMLRRSKAKLRSHLTTR